MAQAYDDPYAALELPHGASDAEIKRAYFALVRAHPPEREPAVFKRIRAAYERLRDPKKRTETDMMLIQPWQPPARKRRPPQLQPTVQAEDIVAAARALTDLDRTDWRDQFQPVKL
jgi:curved DNA-binding protein CbpA